MERRADIVLVQEPPEYDGNRHSGYEYLWAGRVMTARRKDSDWTVSTEDKYTRAAGGDVQVLALGRRGHQGREIRVVNAYFQGTSRTARERRAHQADWDGILSEVASWPATSMHIVPGGTSYAPSAGMLAS